MNILFFKLLIKYDWKLALYYQVHYAWSYLLGFPVLFAGLLQLLSKQTLSVHMEELKRMSKGELTGRPPVNRRRLKRAFKQLQEANIMDIPLGVSLQTYHPVILPEHYINQIVLVLGTTGSGKTVTLLQLAHHAIQKGYPLLWIDAKPTANNVHSIRQEANHYDRSFYGFNCGNFAYYNPFCGKGYTELKDKIMTLKDEWESDYYRSIAEDYLQTTLEVLVNLGKQVDLSAITACLDFHHLALIARESQDVILANKVKSLQHYDRKALTGLQAHLNVLVHSELGGYLLPHTSSTFTLQTVIEQKAVAYFALPALKFPSFAKVLGKLIINDIKSVIEPLEGNTPVFIIFDEFSVFAGEQVLNLVNMGRGKGVHAIFGTQGLADLKKVNDHFESQLLNCVNTIICHRLNDQSSAESITKWIGTQDAYDVTAVVNQEVSQSNLGSLSKNKSFIVHPDEIKQQLNVGEAYVVSKVDGFKVDKIKVNSNN